MITNILSDSKTIQQVASSSRNISRSTPPGPLHEAVPGLEPHQAAQQDSQERAAVPGPWGINCIRETATAATGTLVGRAATPPTPP